MSGNRLLTLNGPVPSRATHVKAVFTLWMVEGRFKVSQGFDHITPFTRSRHLESIDGMRRYQQQPLGLLLTPRLPVFPRGDEIQESQRQHTSLLGLTFSFASIHTTHTHFRIRTHSGRLIYNTIQHSFLSLYHASHRSRRPYNIIG
jgi:hypothetical protein